jgi:hypothetical protein
MSAKAVFVAVATGATASVVVSVTGVVSSATSVAKATENELSTKLKARIKANPFLLFIFPPISIFENRSMDYSINRSILKMLISSPLLSKNSPYHSSLGHALTFLRSVLWIKAKIAFKLNYCLSGLMEESPYLRFIGVFRFLPLGSLLNLILSEFTKY